MNPARVAPIGVFDSGLGGLSVIRQLRSELPRESLLYIADSLYCPYGVRPESEIRERTITLVGRLIDFGAKLIVVACNTASAASIEILRSAYAIPIVAMEPAVKPAMTLTTTGKVAVLATPHTARSERLRLLIERYGVGIEVRAIGVPGLADCVEAGEWAGSRVDALLAPIVSEQMKDDVDVIVLGCTHYPFAMDSIRAMVPATVRIIDSGNAVARRTRDLLITHDLLAGIGPAPSFRMWTTGDPEAVEPIAQRLMGEAIVVEPLDGSIHVGPTEASRSLR